MGTWNDKIIYKYNKYDGNKRRKEGKFANVSPSELLCKIFMMERKGGHTL